MRERKWNLLWIVVSMVSFLLMSSSFLLMPFGATLSLIAGIMFWAFMAIGIMAQIVLARNYKKWCFKNKAWRAYRQKIGVFAIGKNLFAKMADISLILGTAAFTIAMNLTNGAGYSCYVFLTIIVYAFCMHCILNGKVYSYVFEDNERMKKGTEGKEKEE